MSIGGESATHPQCSPKDRLVDPIPLIRFLRRNGIVLLSCIAVCVVGSIAWTALVKPRVFEASALVAVVPPPNRTELQPQTLTVQGYQRIVESPEVKAETARRLVQSGVLSAQAAQGIESNMETRIFVAGNAEEKMLAPMIQLIARASDSKAASTIANVWAEVFIARAHDLMAGSTSSSVRFIENLYPAALQQLNDRENNKTKMEREYTDNFTNTSNEMERQYSQLKIRAFEETGRYKAETSRLTEEMRAKLQIATCEKKLDAIRKAYSDMQTERANVNANLQRAQLELEAARTQLANTPPTLTLRKAITDSELWRNTQQLSDQVDWQKLQDRTLATQETNPIYLELSKRRAQLEMEVNYLRPKTEQLDKELVHLEQVLNELESQYRTNMSALENLRQTREAGLEKLTLSQTTEQNTFERQMQSALDNLRRDGDLQVGQAERLSAQQRDLFTELAKQYNQATLAKAQLEMEDVRLASSAVPPTHSASRGTLTAAILATLFGTILGAALAWARDLYRQA